MSLGNATFSLRVDVTNLVSGLNSAKSFVEQATAQIDALLVGIGTGRAGAAAPFASLEAQLATLNATLETYTAQATQAGAATVSMATPVQVAAGDVAGLTAATTEATAATEADTAAKVANAAATDTMSAANRAAAQGVLSGAGVSTRGGGGLLSGLAGGADLGGVAAFAGELALVTAGFAALRTASDFAKSSVIDFNAELQQDAIRLQNLTGGIDNANKVLAQLAQESVGKSFGGFDFSDLEKGTEILARFGVANQTVERQVADVAAGTGQSYAAVAQQIGRLYDMLDNGQPIGRVAVQLERSGILTADWVSQLEKAQKAGADQARLHAMLTEALSKYNGQAAQLSDTWPAVTNEITNDLKLMAAEAGKPIFDVLLGYLQTARDDLNLVDSGLNTVKDTLGAVGQAIQQHDFAALADDLVKANEQLNTFLAQGILNLPGVTGALQATGHGDIVAAIQDQVKQAQGALGDQFAQAGQQAGKTFVDSFTASSMEKLAQGVARFGDAANPALQGIVASLEVANPLLGEMIADYRTLATDQAAVAEATREAANAQGYYNAITAAAKADLDPIKASLDNAKRVASDHAKLYQDTIAGLQRQSQQIGEQARVADEGWQKTIDDLRASEQTLRDAADQRKQHWQDTIQSAQDDLQNLRDKATADQAAFQAQLDSLQQQQRAESDAASQHAGVYKALLDGTIDEYVQLIGKEDDLTQAVRARWQEEVEGQLRAKTGADDAVRAKQEEQDKSTLALDTQIAQARQQGNQREVAALEERKKQINAGYAAELQLLNDKKKVADDQFQDTSDQVNKAAQQQAMKDQAAQNATKQQIQGVQDAQKAQKQADDEAIKAQQDRIKGLQDQATQQDRTDRAAIKGVQDQITQDQNLKSQQDARFKAEQDNIRTQIAAVQRQQQAQELMDKAKEAADQQHYDDRKAYWDQEKTQAHDALTTARATETSAKNQLTYDTQHLDNLKQQAQWQDYINKLIAHGQGLRQIPLPATEGPRAPNVGAPPDYTTPAAPGQPGYIPPFPVGTPHPDSTGVGPTSGQQPVLTAADYRPPGGGVVNQTNTYNVTGADPKTVMDQIGAHVFDATQAALDQASRGGYNLARVRA